MKKKKNKKTYSADHVVVILEDIQSKFGVLSDGQKLLNEKIDKLDSRVDKLEDNVEVFRNEVTQQFKAVAGILTEMNDRLDDHENKIDRMQGDVTEIKHKLSKKADSKDFQALEKRFVKLEKPVFAKLAH